MGYLLEYQYVYIGYSNWFWLEGVVTKTLLWVKINYKTLCPENYWLYAFYITLSPLLCEASCNLHTTDEFAQFRNTRRGAWRALGLSEKFIKNSKKSLQVEAEGFQFIVRGGCFSQGAYISKPVTLFLMCRSVYY